MIAFEQPLQDLKKNAREPNFFENMIRKAFIENSHRSTVFLVPDGELSARTEAEEKQRLADIKADMSSDELDQIVDNTNRLLELQSTPDSEEALATIPLLQREDLDKEIRVVEHNIDELHGATLVKHNLFTNGILYLDLGIDLHGLSQEDLPYASLLGSILLEMGTKKEDYVSLSQRIAKGTGGIYGTPFLSAQLDESTGITRFFPARKMHG